eukprot:CAMPEP_0115032872 /NCGR_PEP_ID=MMETSP0216-20121206/39453_1 /TAXON_ID=223996 /ORGANISM="Protocruzia adherens, Strain Boccale" /LENGTH=198 /DNA_ID=CAMNT_0002410927 /DNA_START=105 /DNA_END=698 /DNA_ORIENTATION=+
MFMLHNESFNVWSHFCGAIFYGYMIFYVLMYVSYNPPQATLIHPNIAQNGTVVDHAHPALTWSAEDYVEGWKHNIVDLEQRIEELSRSLRDNLSSGPDFSYERLMEVYDHADDFKDYIEKEIEDTKNRFFEKIELEKQNMIHYYHRLHDTDGEHYVETWPIIFFLITAIFCLMGSAIFHLFSAYNFQVPKIEQIGLCW